MTLKISSRGLSVSAAFLLGAIGFDVVGLGAAARADDLQLPLLNFNAPASTPQWIVTVEAMGGIRAELSRREPLFVLWPARVRTAPRGSAAALQFAGRQFQLRRAAQRLVRRRPRRQLGQRPAGEEQSRLVRDEFG